MATSSTTLLRTALRAIADADATLRTLTGRTTRIMVPWETVAAAQKPVLAVFLAPNVRIGGLGDRRRVTALIAGFAEGSGAKDKAEALTQRCREIYTPGAFQGQSMDAFVDWWTAQERESDAVTDPSSPTLVTRSDLELPIIFSAPQ